jgi:glucosamine--fructose-6-phosphate aminotransferase (isomerizing)
MCGIIGYVGPRPVAEVLLTGLHQLEYRGYDSAGVTIVTGTDITYERAILEDGVSGIDRIAGQLGQRGRAAGTGIAHTRWATHGMATVENAHPHRDCAGTLFVVHNGEVLNDAELRRELVGSQHLIRSETDTELIAHCIERERLEAETLADAVARALARINGALAIAVLSTRQPDHIVCARRGSPLLVGLGEHETIIASDEAAIIGVSRKIVDLHDGDIVTVTRDGIQGIQRSTRISEWSVEQAQKGGYPHFTRKEIAEQADTVSCALNRGGRLVRPAGDARLGGLERFGGRLRETDHIRLVAAGTAYHAAQIGRQMLLEVARIPHVEAELSSEVHDTSFHVGPATAVIAISQSGETKDTLDAVEEARRRGALTIGVVNKIATAIPRLTDCGVYCNAGPEIGVASTKAFVSQLTALALIALFIGRRRGLSDAEGQRIAEALLGLPGQVFREIEYGAKFGERARNFRNRRCFFVIGRKWHYPVALEAALKMKEIAYVHAEGYAAGELKHGPLAVLSEDAVVLALAPKDETFHDVLLAIQQARKTGATVIGLTTPDGERDVREASGTVPHLISPTLPMLQPILSIIPLQLFAYELAVALERDVDKPRHLAKSVTVN